MNHQGFTLIELLIVMTLLATMLTLSNHGYGLLYRRQEITIKATQIYQAMQYARSLGMAHEQTIGICGTQDNYHCSTHWSHGFLLFTADTTLPKQPPLPESMILNTTWKTTANITSHQQPVFYFTANGRCLTRGTITLDGSGIQQQIVVFDSGRIRMGS